MRIVRSLFAFLLRIFFRRLEVSGAEHVPANGAALFVVNHPNALIDPVLLLALVPRRVVFLAKAPLFRMPVIGWLVRRTGAIPVERHGDPGANPARNAQMFANVRGVLAGGGAVAVFPEGVSHNEPQLRPFKTGAARIALEAARAGVDVNIIPAGLFYTAKTTFRSAVLLQIGAPVHLPGESGAAMPGPPDPVDVRRLTDRLKAALSDVTLQADHHDAVALATRAELVLTSGDAADGGRLPLAEQLEVRRRLIAGHGWLRRNRPAQLAQLERSLARVEARLAQVGLDAETHNYTSPSRPAVGRAVLRMLWYTALVLPVAALGIAIHYPAYRLVGRLAGTAARNSEDLEATAKLLIAALLFPLTWLLSAVAAVHLSESGVAWLMVLLAPAAGFVGLRFVERLDRFLGEGRGVWLHLVRPAAYRSLFEDRAALRDELLALAHEVADD